MDLVHLSTKDDVYLDNSTIPLSLAAQFMSRKAEQNFLVKCRDISFQRLITRIEGVSSVPKEFHQKDSVDVLLVEVNINQPDDMQYLQTLLENDFVNIPVIVTASDVTLNMTRELMYMGVVDVLIQPFTETDILTVMKRACEKNGRHDGLTAKGKVISFIKGGGGVGATTLAVQSGCFLATKLAKYGMDVSLLDMDIQFGTAGLYLDMQNDDGLMGILAARDRMDGTLLKGLFNKHDTTGLNVLTIPRDVVPMDVISDDIILRILRILRQEHKFTIVDMPGVWTPWSAKILENSDMIILVTEISISAISQAKRQLDALQDQGLGDIPVKVVINRFTNKSEKVFSIHSVEEVLERRIDHKIPNDYKLVCNAENKGVPLMNIVSKSKVDKSIRDLISEVVGELTDVDIKSYLAEASPSFMERIGLRHVFTKK
ncbi:MAG: AAA family ATPase [Emcibacter sp.]|nr:AAA family ATPase [Emcibacter sp.]